MRSVIFKKLKEALISVLPIVLIVLVLNFTPLVNMQLSELVAFLISAALLIVGIGLFNLGADLAMTPMGEHIGSGLTKTKSLALLLSVSFGMGLLITVAEPDLTVLANQVKDIMSSTALIVTVGVGVGIFLLLAVIKIVFRVQLSGMLMFSYAALFAMCSMLIINGGEALIPLAFDSGGVTTGPITVPFILALGVGIASSIGGRNSGENSFGLIALCSVGPMLAVLLLGSLVDGQTLSFTPDYEQDISGAGIISTLLHTAGEVAMALGLIVLFFVILEIAILKLPKKKLVQIAVGIGYTFLGLVIFLSAVKLGFMPVGYKLGVQLAEKPVAIVIISFVIGMLVVLAEPAVHVLNRQVEGITEGTVSRRSMTVALCCGVGISICLSIIRIILDFNILYYLIPGYLISLGLSFFVPRMYTAIAFDSGGVASGPLTSTFILPLAVGACVALQGQDKILTDGFGVVAMVALAPLITIQLLGFRAVMTRRITKKLALKRILAADDEQIIDFM